MFLPAERAPQEDIERQIGLFVNSPLLTEMLDASPDVLLVLNQQRQIVFANERAMDLAGMADRRQLYGLRPGESLGCIHAYSYPAGCGTTEFCLTCGAAQAIRDGLAGQTAVEDCRLLRGPGREALDLRAWSRPLELQDETFTILSLTDTSNEQRRLALERVFFHDLLNTAGALRGLLEILAEAAGQPPEELAMAHQLAESLIDEIEGQRTLLAAERGNLAADPHPVELGLLLSQLAEQYRRQPWCEDRQVALDLSAEPMLLSTDTSLVRRVIGNLVKNALEASAPGERITVSCRPDGAGFCIGVRNPAAMPRQVQLQLFKRSFSTKGPGRGLGTYSVRLLTERYLHGRVSFTSEAGEGTCFRVWLPRKPQG
jgi:signal transduction histidine kinase